MSSTLKTISWILLTLVGALTLLGALASVNVAYFAEDDQIGPVTRSELAGDSPQVATALGARRGTAAAFAAAFAALFLFVVLVPYRRGEVWSWWAVLVGTLVCSGFILLRLPTLDTSLGAGTGTTLLIVVVVALLLDVRRLKSGSAG